MYTQVDKSAEDKRKAVANTVAQKKSDGKKGFELIDNRPEFAAQGGIQKMADNRSHVTQLREAGSQPIRVNADDEDHELSISGLINCVGVVIMIYGEGNRAFDHVAVVGGHFVTPTMYQFGDEPGFTESGQMFIDNINTQIDGIDRERLEPTYYVKAPAVEGANPESLVQATTAAEKIRSTLGLGGQIVQAADTIRVSV